MIRNVCLLHNSGGAAGSEIEASCFIRSLRALVGPRELNQMMQVFDAIGVASAEVAAAAQVTDKVCPDH